MVTVSPSPPMSPDSLSVLSTIDPSHASAVLSNYPTSSQQYMVMFDGLTPGTIYIYDIRVILRNDSTTTIDLPVTGSFTVLGTNSLLLCGSSLLMSMPPSFVGLSREAEIALSVSVTFLLTLVLGVSIGALIVLAVNKCRRSEKVTLQTETEMRQPPVIYEEPGDIKPEPHTQGNLAYGHIHFS